MWLSNPKRVPGFTLVELTVVLILSGILVTGLLNGMGYIQQSWNDYRRIQETWSEWDEFRSQLQYDWNRAYQVVLNNDYSFTCIEETRQVTYAYLPTGQWLRQQGLYLDTLQVTSSEPIFSESDNLLIGLNLQCELTGSLLPISLTKPYLRNTEINQLLNQ